MTTGLILCGVLVAGVLGWLIARGRDAKHLCHHVEDVPPVDEPAFARSMGAVLGMPFCAGNRVTRLRNGDEIFPAMLDALAAARTSICFETYIYWSGDTGRQFAEILQQRARAGVQVRVLLDWVGSLPMDDELVEAMRAAGCEVRRFHKPNWRHPSRLNHRTHRKILVVDGRVGFTGGVGIADKWTGDAEDPEHWRDSHFRLEGPAVGQLQSAFMSNWIRTTGKVELGDDWFPPLPPLPDGAPGHVFLSSPDEGSENARLAFLLALGAARRRIRIATPYFVPDRLARRSLVAAAKRGVRIQILVTGQHTDARLIRWASRALWRELLAAGIELHEYQPTMLHVKVLLIDDTWAAVGSANIDQRSFRLNDESNLQIDDPRLAADLHRDFDQDLAVSRRIDLATWKRRPLSERLLGRAATLLRSQM